MDNFPYEEGWVPEYEANSDYQYVEDLPLKVPVQFEEQYEEDPFENVNIQDSYQEVEEDDDLYTDAWIPYSGLSDPFETGIEYQQVVIGSPYPAASDLKQHFCDLYPDICLNQGGPLENNVTQRSNGTLEGDVSRGMGLNHVDLSGFGLALLLLLLILLGLNGGWSGGKSDQDDEGKPRNGKGKKGSDENKKQTRDQKGKGGDEGSSGSGKKGRSSRKDGKDKNEGEENEGPSRSNKKNKRNASKDDDDRSTEPKRAPNHHIREEMMEKGMGSKEEAALTEEMKMRENQRGPSPNPILEDEPSENTNKQGHKSKHGKTGAEDEPRPKKGKSSKKGDRDEDDRGGKRNTKSGSRSNRTGDDDDGRHGKNKQKGSKIQRKDGDDEDPPKKSTQSSKNSSRRPDRKGDVDGKDGKKTSSKNKGSKHGRQDGDTTDPKNGRKSSKKNKHGKDEKNTAGKDDEGDGKSGKRTKRTSRPKGDGKQTREDDEDDGKKSSGKDRKPRKDGGKAGKSDGRKSGSGNDNSDGSKSGKGGQGGKGEEDRERGGLGISPPILLGLLVLLALMGFAGRGQIPQMPHMPTWRTPTFFSQPREVIGTGILGGSGSIIGKGGLLGKDRILGSNPALGKARPTVITTPKIIPAGAKAPKLVVSEPEPVIAAVPVGSQPLFAQPAQPATGGDGKTQIHINNVNSQGNGNPINIDSSIPVKPVGVIIEDPVMTASPNLKTTHIKSSSPLPPITDVPPVIVEEKVWEPISFHFTGPTNPDRLWNMLLVTFFVLFPLIVDWILDYPEKRYSLPDYLPPTIQLMIIITLLLLGILIADWHFGWTATIAPYAEVSVTEVQGGLTPVLIGVIETTESLIWGIEDVIFGDGRILLGMGLAALGVVLLSQREPISDVPETKYASGTSQVAFFFGALLIGTLFWNA